MKRRFFCGLLCLLAVMIAAASLPVSADNSRDAVGESESLADGIAAFKNQTEDLQSWIDGGLSDGAGQTSEWYIIALSQSGTYDFSRYSAALSEYVAGNEIYSAATRQKLALAFLATGKKDGYVLEVMEDSIGKQGIMSYVFGLHLLNNGLECSAGTADSVKEKLLSLRLADGGWALTGSVSDVDVTAMTVQALAPYYASDGEVKTAVDGALDLLSARQLDSGDFQNYGKPNAESTAQVLLALSELGIDGLTDERFIKNGKNLLDGIKKYRLQDGSFCHEEGGSFNESATAQVYFSSVAYVRMMNGKGAFYILDNRNGIKESPKDNGSDSDIVSQPKESGNPGPDAESVGTDLKAEDGKPNRKLWVSVGVIVVAVIVCLVLFAAKKRNYKNFILVLIAAALIIVFVFTADFRSAEDYYNGSGVSKENTVGTVTLEIRCDTVAGKSDSSYIPDNGTVLEKSSFEIREGDTVYHILTEAARKHNIQLDAAGGEKMAYVAGINYLYELQFGDLSGWVYRVNGESPSAGCSEYKLKDGDEIVWYYTCESGNDIP